MLFNLADNTMTGFELAILSSKDAADSIIREFKRKYHGQDPQSLLDSIVENTNVDDIFPEDVERVKEAVLDYLEEID